MKILSFIWDYDGTLVDSRRKNLNVTKKIIKKITDKEAECFPVLKSVDSYFTTITSFPNWRDFYAKSFNLDENQINQAGILWTEQQLADYTESPLIPGMKNLIKKLSNYKHAIVSQNSRSMIIQNLQKYGVCEYFDSIIGYEEVSLDEQKPNPKGLFLAVNKITNVEAGTVLFIGDQDSDIECACQAKNELSNKGIKIFSVYLNHFGIPFSKEKLSFRPDFEIFSPAELLNLVDI